VTRWKFYTEPGILLPVCVNPNSESRSENKVFYIIIKNPEIDVDIILVIRNIVIEHTFLGVFEFLEFCLKQINIFFMPGALIRFIFCCIDTRA
jgi:hypothetical protein